MAVTTVLLAALFVGIGAFQPIIPAIRPWQYSGEQRHDFCKKQRETVRLHSSSSSSKIEETDTAAQYDNKNNIRDQVVSAISGCGSVKVTACTVRNMVNEMMIQHTMTAVPADALGRTVTCAVLMANGMQEEQTVQITMKADGPLRGIMALCTGKGEVRGYVGSPMLGEMDLEAAVGRSGQVQIVKNHPDWPNPYNGITAIRHGDIDRDIGLYLAESEQRSCALAAATSVKGILCHAAGGYLVEQLPGADPETVRQVEQNLAKLVELNSQLIGDGQQSLDELVQLDSENNKSGDGNKQKLPSGLLLKGTTPYQIAEILLEGLELQPLQQLEPSLKCDCTSDRLLRAVRLLPQEEVEDILNKEEKLEARCHFCGKVYQMNVDELREKLAEAKGDPSKDDDY